MCARHNIVQARADDDASSRAVSTFAPREEASAFGWLFTRFLFPPPSTVDQIECTQ